MNYFESKLLNLLVARDLSRGYVAYLPIPACPSSLIFLKIFWTISPNKKLRNQVPSRRKGGKMRYIYCKITPEVVLDTLTSWLRLVSSSLGYFLATRTRLS